MNSNNTTNSIDQYIVWAPFVPSEVEPSYRYKFYTEQGEPRYAVEVNPQDKRYIRESIRLITDPDWYSRKAYRLYDLADVDDIDWLQTAMYLVDGLDLVSPSRIMALL
jgi:hypothetical protein